MTQPILIADILGPGNPNAMAPEDVAAAAMLAADLSDRSFVAGILLQPSRLG